MNILITSPRAPIVLEWIRIAERGGHQIALCDSLRFPLARFSRTPVQYHQIPAPRLDFSGYQKAILPLIEWADWVIPTCEDIFYLAQLPLNETQRQKCFMPDNALLFGLHHKIEVYQHLPQTEHIRFPASRLITQISDVEYDTAAQKTVLKPIFSRFGRSVIRGVTPENTQGLSISTEYPWVQQQFIEGQALCNYAVCVHGKVVGHSIYRPRYLLNQSASTYFEPVEDARIQAFIHAFAEQTGYHGQVAFDFIDDGCDLWVLECNPRATSGLHLIGDALEINTSGQLCAINYQSVSSQPMRAGKLLPLLFGWEAFKKGEWQTLMADYRRAKDVTASLPSYAAWLALGEMCYRQWQYHKPLTSASTFDIEFDGCHDDHTKHSTV